MPVLAQVKRSLNEKSDMRQKRTLTAQNTGGHHTETKYEQVPELSCARAVLHDLLNMKWVLVLEFVEADINRAVSVTGMGFTDFVNLYSLPWARAGCRGLISVCYDSVLKNVYLNR